jgi:hypothetical protein
MPSGAVLCLSPAGLTNLGSVVTIVVANKVVMSTYKFSFPVCLTWFHSIVTALGMMAMAAAGIFQVRDSSNLHCYLSEPWSHCCCMFACLSALCTAGMLQHTRYEAAGEQPAVAAGPQVAWGSIFFLSRAPRSVHLSSKVMTHPAVG